MTGPERTPRAPSSVLLVDANIILSAALGRRSRSVFAEVITDRTVVTTERVAEEVRGVLRTAPELPSDAVIRADALLAGIEVVASAVYADRLAEAAAVLSHAVASRNGSTADAHLLACAWVFDADLWSHDRDFAGTGWPSWSNANLRRALGPSVIHPPIDAA